MLKKRAGRQEAAENTSGGSCARDVSLKKLVVGNAGKVLCLLGIVTIDPGN
jgi:hypothetical protein